MSVTLLEKFDLKMEELLNGLNHSYDGILLSDKRGRIFFANKAVERISGISLNKIIGKTSAELMDEGIIVSQSSTGLQRKYPLTITQKLNTGVEVFITSKPVLNEKGERVCFICNYRELKSLNDLYKAHLKHEDADYHELQELRTRLLQTDDWIGESQQMKNIKEKVFKVARTEASVLIMGESGVGKEIVAKTIHKLSNRAPYPFVQINCGAIPENLLEAELFGYEKGAFTGAGSKKMGLLEVANNGTVLLDEIGEMPLHLQVKLLRVIQTKEITRVGGTIPVKLNIRFLSATNRDLEQMIEENRFREDLYYRLNVVPIVIPPLRERKEDILPLARYFLQRFVKKYDVRKELSMATCQLLEQFEWPGNVRQLENIIERTVIMTEEEWIHPDSLPFELSKRGSRSSFQTIIPLKQVVEETEKDMILLALRTYKSIREAARYLEIDHTTLIRKMKKWNISK
ncbi:MAG TPA: sigma 54-interacting transcriptional regulator [Chondromyces sp.]|nr:sigma 54-interacting transcriptional regulator [Chondromyces sp.]